MGIVFAGLGLCLIFVSDLCFSVILQDFCPGLTLNNFKRLFDVIEEHLVP